jgi:hypothetical protein
MPSVFDVHQALESFGVLEAGTGRAAKRIVAWGMSIGAAVGVLVVAGIQIATVPVQAADKTYWTVEGPFSRVSGAVVCTDIADGSFGLVKGTTCQFNAPRALAVGSEGGFAYYDVPDGPATVTVSRTSPPRCVLAAHYKGE